MVSFQDPTNIPLELVIASLQPTDTVLIKEITNPDDVDDAVVTLGVMEVGADGVMYSPQSHDRLDSFLKRLDESTAPSVTIETATVVRTAPVGMGYRSCIDLATMFSPDEGMLVGSTSQGGILCCPEVFYLPYMELRPFRVNAGAVHSYVYNAQDKTNYMTELRAGSPVMVVGTNGKTRPACVGRMKTEVRPLRLIEAEFAGGERVNVLMQDDWHVRIFSAEGKPLNITELKPGDRILGHPARPGRHVGIKVEERILEN
jgi:3-dehydroquinate synthase II/3-amino-4-hydroxybenzoic acid synthase